MKHLIGAVIALSLLGSTAAVAQRDNQDYQRNFNEPNNDRPHWSRGDRLPEQYRQDRYVVGDWKQHNLRTPPRGYHWVRNDNNQFILAAIATGIIYEIVSENQNRDDYRWSRGERLSDGYRDNRYVVADWRNSHLQRPGRGSHWVHVNDQYMLISGNGVIVQIVSDRR